MGYISAGYALVWLVLIYLLLTKKRIITKDFVTNLLFVIGSFFICLYLIFTVTETLEPSYRILFFMLGLLGFIMTVLSYIFRQLKSN